MTSRSLAVLRSEHEAAGRPAPPGRRGRRVWWWALADHLDHAPGQRGAGDLGVQVQERAFEAGGGSGIVASKRYPGCSGRSGPGRPGPPGKPQNALYAYKVSGGRVGTLAGGASFKAFPMPVEARDWEDIGRQRGQPLVADIGDNECDRTDTALLKVREPDPARQTGPASLLATYRYRFPDPPSGCAGRNAEAMFLVDDVPYLIDKAEPSTLYRFPALDPGATVTLEKVGVRPARWPTSPAPTCPPTGPSWPSTPTPPCTSTRPPTPPPRSRAGGRPDQPPPGLDGPARRPGPA